MTGENGESWAVLDSKLPCVVFGCKNAVGNWWVVEGENGRERSCPMCKAHSHKWQASREYLRWGNDTGEVALMDFINRINAENRNGAQVANVLVETTEDT